MLATKIQIVPQQAILALTSVTGAALIAMLALVRIPMWPVPMTLQTLAVLLIAGTLGLRVGLGSVLAYVGSSALGWPVAAGGAAVGGPTTGYLVGFFAQAVIIGSAVDRGWFKSTPKLLVVILIANTMVFLPGVAWLAVFWMPSVHAAVSAGLTPFLAGDLVKAALGFVYLAALHRRASPCR